MQLNEIPVRIVLCRSIYESNVGSVSRVMSNMGATSLILIDRKCTLTFKAQQAAATGQDGLRNRTEYADLGSYLQESQGSLRMAFTCRDGKERMVQPLGRTLAALPQAFANRVPAGSLPDSIDLIFGPEDAGLNGEEIDCAHFACSLSTFGPNLSLNLSHAVLVALYEVKKFLHQDLMATLSEATLSDENYPFPEESLREWLKETGFDVIDRPINAFSTLRRLFMRAIPSTKEKKMLETVFQQGLRKMTEYNELRRRAGLPAGYSSAHRPHSTSTKIDAHELN